MDESTVRELERDAAVRRVLLQSAQLLERDGWCQYVSRDLTGQRCLFGAVWGVLVGESALYHEAWGRLDAYLFAQRPWYLRWIPWPGPIVWNDAPGRKASEVISALRAAAYS